ncbi:hypothetical protein [Haliangium sp.]|uniref:hypothetical protein n=1 Tax=Haliangium sp. TaxID=2663208 RepID=UPI003D0D6973
MRNDSNIFSFFLGFWLIQGAVTGACGGGSGDVPGPDAGGRPNKRLVILDPPGDELPLTYNSRETLYVRYLTELGQVVRGQELRFSLVANRPGESTAGATLSAPSALTGMSGEARVDLFTGAQEARFRVAVEAADAATVYFFVSVSQSGFAELEVTPVHDGWRPEASLDRVELRIYPGALTRCDSVDIDAPPASAFPPRGLDGFGGAVSFQSINAGQPHTVVAWAQAQTPTPVAAGCLELDGSQLPPSLLRVDLVVADRALVLPPEAALSSRFDLAAVAQSLADSGLTRAWDTLACPLGAGQLALDCALDAAVPDAALDCVVTGTGALIVAADARRGSVDGGGCRPAVDGDGASSLDKLLDDAVTTGASFPRGAALSALVATRAEVVSAGLELDSALSFPSPGAAAHRLLVARVPLADDPVSVDLAASARQVVNALQVPATITGDRLNLGEHGFTLGYADVAARAFTAAGLTPASLDDPGTLGQALIASVHDDNTGQDGCTALSALACAAMGEPTSCLSQACDDATPVLDEVLAAWLDGLAPAAAGLDFQLQGEGPLRDDDGDLVVDDVGGEPAGAWEARLELRDRAGDAAVAVPGQF